MTTKSVTRFFWRNRHPLGVVAVLAAAGVMALYQFTRQESAHVQLREDFILLERAAHAAEASHLYQHLVQKLPALPLRALIDDLERLAMVPTTNTPPGQSLTEKYHIAVRRELEQRSSRRLPTALKRGRPGGS
ncbi:MAG: hypothetical protein JXQ71_01050 [Verrucomicrobia bacterium]|nr:hypothetical protein [Verrucomicrobiota bacterium]